MIWLTWRQQRLETAMSALVLVLVAAVLVPLGSHMASVYEHSGTAACVAHAATSPSTCGSVLDSFTQRFEHSGTIIPWLNFLPGLFGVLFAAPFVLEFERGTFRLVWTQSITRRRWLTIKLAAICLCGIGAALALTALMTWWRQPLDHLQGRMQPNVFDFEGIVPYAYTFFGAALAVALGVFTRRMIVALVGTLLAYFALRITLQTWIRQHYLSPVKTIWRPGHAEPTQLAHAWILQSGPVDGHGHAVSAQRVISTCPAATKHGAETCLAAHHVFNSFVYQPATRFWLFQGIESGIFAGLGLLLLAAATWWIRRRIA